MSLPPGRSPRTLDDRQLASARFDLEVAVRDAACGSPTERAATRWLHGLDAEHLRRQALMRAQAQHHQGRR